MSKTCPKCSRQQEPAVAICDCGHAFDDVPAPTWPVSSLLSVGTSPLGNFFLLLGMVASLVGCLLAVVWSFRAVSDGAVLLGLAGGAMSFAYSAAMFVVFKRVRQL